MFKKNLNYLNNKINKLPRLKLFLGKQCTFNTKKKRTKLDFTILSILYINTLTQLLPYCQTKTQSLRLTRKLYLRPEPSAYIMFLMLSGRSFQLRHAETVVLYCVVNQNR